MEKYREYEAFIDERAKELHIDVKDSATAAILKLDYLISDLEMKHLRMKEIREHEKMFDEIIGKKLEKALNC